MAKQRGGARTFWVTLVVLVVIAAIILGVLGGLGYFKKSGSGSTSSRGPTVIPGSGGFQPSGSGSVHFPGGYGPHVTTCTPIITGPSAWGEHNPDKTVTFVVAGTTDPGCPSPSIDTMTASFQGDVTLTATEIRKDLVIDQLYITVAAPNLSNDNHNGTLTIAFKGYSTMASVPAWIPMTGG